MNQRRLTKAPSEPGLWAAVPAASSSRNSSVTRADVPSIDEVAETPISWLPRPKLWRRIARNISIPATVGISAFVIALVVTAWIVVQSLTGEPLEALHQPVADQQSFGAAAASGDTSVTAGEGGGAGLLSGATGGPDTLTVLVHVIGEVQQPGVVELASGARVLDAITAAGGATDMAALTAINLARTVSDGEQIVVPDAALAEALAQTLGADGPTGVGGHARGLHSGDSAGAEVVNLNSASVDQLTQLPRIGPSIAQRIVEWRDANGGFTSVDQLLEVSGIGTKTIEAFRDRVGV